MNGWSNYDDVVGQLQAAGLILKGPLRADLPKDKFVRCKVVDGDAEARGWYKLFTLGDILTGAFGVWSANDPRSFKVELPKSERKRLTADELAAMKAKQDADKKRAEADRAREIESASQKATRWWRKLQDAGESGYMAKKGFNASDLFGARISPSGNLVVPVQDAAGKTYGLQVIFPKKQKNDRDKDFTPPGLAKKGHFFQLGLVQRGGVVLLCEGFATGASLRAATGLPVVVAFDAGNLTAVAIEIHKAHRKDVKILLCADDDYRTLAKTGKNPGIDSAQTAALAVGGAVVWPAFPDERPTDTKGPTDFNDLHVHPGGGLQAVRAQIEKALATAGWAAPKRVRAAGGTSGGEGASSSGGPSGTEARRGAMAIMPLDELVERFIPLDDGTGDYVFDAWTNKVAKKAQMLALLPAGVRGDDIKRHPVWVSRGAYYLDQVGFDPAGTDTECKLNTWQGWPIKPKAGGCQGLLDTLRYLCNNEGEEKGEEVYQWLLRWMAYPLQHPGAKMNSAVIMHGPQGTGKSMVFQSLAKIYGNYSTVLNQRGLEDKFNSDWSDSKLFILAEEVVTRAEMWHIKNELKELVTGEWIRINPKNIAAYRQRNHVNICYLSNENQPLPIENDDRRHLVVYTPPALTEDYYDEVWQEIEAGGVEALYHYLLELDLTGFHPKKRPPMTEAKERLMLLSSPSEVRFITEWSMGRIGLPVCPALSGDVYSAYTKWCAANGETRPRASNHFHGAVKHVPGWDKKDARLFMGEHDVTSQCKAMVFPPSAAVARSGMEMAPGETLAAYNGRCARAFAESLGHPEGLRWAA